MKRFLAAPSIATCTALAVFAGGCAMLKSDWKTDSSPLKPAAGLQAPRTDPESVVFGLAFVSIVAPLDEKTPADGVSNSDDPFADVWRWIDETAIPADVRDQWRRNGLRVGRVHTKSEFLRALDLVRRTPRDKADKLLDTADVGSDLNHLAKQVPCRFNRRVELPVRKPAAGEVATLVSLDGHPMGRTLANAQPLFSLVANPLNASGIRLKLKPEIQHGTAKQTWVGSDSALRIGSKRESWELDELAFELSLATGDLLVAGATRPTHGLGQQMFTGTTTDGDTDQVMMVLHVAELPKPGAHSNAE